MGDKEGIAIGVGLHQHMEQTLNPHQSHIKTQIKKGVR
jgi:hypothetical protein